MSQLLQVGDVVRVKAHGGSPETFMNQPENTLGYIYELYPWKDGWGVAVISENGMNLGGFSNEDQEDYIVYVSSLEFRYVYEDLPKLKLDWEDGIFQPFLDEVKELKSTC